MLIHFWTVIFLFAIFLGILVVLLLLGPVTNRKHSNILLALYILCFVLFSIHNFLLQEGLMLKVPYLYRFPKALQYVIAPLIFLYVRSVVLNEVSFRKWDWVLMMPAVLHTVELLPFFFMKYEEKSAMVAALMEDMNAALVHSEGILPAFVHPVLMCSYSGFLIWKSFALLRTARRSTAKVPVIQNLIQLKWLHFFCVANALLVIILVLHLLTFSLVPINTYLLNNIEGALIMSSIGVALFFYPNILYGFQHSVEPIRNPEPEQDKSIPEAVEKGYSLSDERRQEYLQLIKKCFEDKQVFLQPRYTIRQLSEETGVPYTYLSQVINQEYAMNFNELVNRYRVDYIKKLLREPDAHQYTFEALGERAGFQSRATFSRAFHKVVGCTPSEYLKSLPHK